MQLLDERLLPFLFSMNTIAKINIQAFLTFRNSSYLVLTFFFSDVIKSGGLIRILFREHLTEGRQKFPGDLFTALAPLAKLSIA